MFARIDTLRNPVPPRLYPALRSVSVYPPTDSSFTSVEKRLPVYLACTFAKKGPCAYCSAAPTSHGGVSTKSLPAVGWMLVGETTRSSFNLLFVYETER